MEQLPYSTLVPGEVAHHNSAHVTVYFFNITTEDYTSSSYMYLYTSQNF